MLFFSLSSYTQLKYEFQGTVKEKGFVRNDVFII